MPGRTIRPVMDRVKAYIFDVLAERVAQAAVCDLFAGTGSLGIEALSRGAAAVTFVDANPEAVRLIRKNLRLLAAEAGAQVWLQDALQFVRRATAAFDIVFCDPPYRYDRTAEVVSLIGRRGLLAAGGILAVEHDPAVAFSEAPAGLEPWREKKFGRTQTDHVAAPTLLNAAVAGTAPFFS